MKAGAGNQQPVAVLNMLKVDSGQVFFEGGYPEEQQERIEKERRDMQLIFGTLWLLNPRMTIGSALEVLYIHHIRIRMSGKVIELIEMVGLNKIIYRGIL